MIYEMRVAFLTSGLVSQTAGLLMLGQIRLQCKFLPTSRAGEGFHLGVRLYMRPQIAFISKRFVALAAGEGLLPGVGSDVALKQPGS